MNMLDVQDKLKGLSEQQLVQEMQMPSGSAPQFLVLSEITRRKRMRDSMQQQPDNSTVAQEAVAASGVPQGGIADMARALAPKTDMTQNTGAMPVQGMYGGGRVQRMQEGGEVEGYEMFVEPPQVGKFDILALMRELDRRDLEEFTPRTREEELAWYAKQLHDGGFVLPEALNPLSSAEEAFAAYGSGDYPGAALNALSAIPMSRGPSVAANSAAELYNRLMGGDESGSAVGMYGGGYVQKMQPGGFVDSKSLVPYSQQNFPSALASDPAVIAMAQRLGIPVEEYIASLSPDTRAKNLQRVVDGRITQAPRSDVFDPTVPALSQVDGTQEFRPYTSAAVRGSLIPTQADLDARYRASLAEEPRFVGVPLEPESGGTGPSVLNLASPPQSLYPEVPVGNPIPGEEPSFYTPPERLQPMSPMERLRAETDYMRSGEGLPAYNEFRGVFDARENPMLTAAEESAKEAAELRDSAGITQSLRNPKEVAAAAAAAKRVAAADAEAEDSMTQVPSPLELPEPPGLSDLLAGDTTTGGTRTSGGVGSASGATSYEQELINAMQRAERRAEQDKWLALAQVGLGLMSSTQPTIGGALGEAGLAGLQSYQGARDEYETERLGLSKELAGIEAARASQRAAAAKASSGPTLQQLIDARDALYTKSTNEFGEDVIAPMQGAEGEIAQINAAIRSRVGSMAAPTM
jgi:hypothetical protein